MPLLSLSGKLAVLRNPNLAFYLSSRFPGTLAVQMQSVAIGWQVYQITGSLFDLGLIGLAQCAPFLVLFGSARAFKMPASQAVLKNLVPDRDFSQAVALGSSTFHVAVIAGPIIGGLLYAFGPMTVHLVAASQARSQGPVSWHSLMEGLRFVWSRPIVLGAISLDLLVQYATPDDIRGRVGAVNAVFIGASNELGEFESGVTAGWLGLVRPILLGGAATLVVTGLWSIMFPVLSRMDRFPHHEKEKARRLMLPRCVLGKQRIGGRACDSRHARHDLASEFPSENPWSPLQADGATPPDITGRGQNAAAGKIKPL